MAKGKERPTISGRPATGNAQHSATRKNRKESTHFRKGRIFPNRNEKAKRKEAIAKGGKGYQYVDINAWTVFIVSIQ